MYSLIEYSNNCSKTGGLWQYYRDESALDANSAVIDFSADSNNSASFKFKTKIAGKVENDGTKTLK